MVKHSFPLSKNANKIYDERGEQTRKQILDAFRADKRPDDEWILRALNEVQSAYRGFWSPTTSPFQVTAGSILIGCRYSRFEWVGENGPIYFELRPNFEIRFTCKRNKMAFRLFQSMEESGTFDGLGEVAGQPAKSWVTYDADLPTLKIPLRPFRDLSVKTTTDDNQKLQLVLTGIRSFMDSTFLGRSVHDYFYGEYSL